MKTIKYFIASFFLLLLYMPNRAESQTDIKRQLLSLPRASATSAPGRAPQRLQEVGIRSLFVQKVPATGEWYGVSLLPDQETLSFQFRSETFSPGTLCFKDVSKVSGEVACGKFRKNIAPGYDSTVDDPSQIRIFDPLEVRRFRGYYDSLSTADKESYLLKFLKVYLPTPISAPPACTAAHVTGVISSILDGQPFGGSAVIYLSGLNAQRAPFAARPNSFGLYRVLVNFNSKEFGGLRKWEKIGANITPYGNGSVTEMSTASEIFPCHAPDTLKNGYVLGDADGNGRVDADADVRAFIDHLGNPSLPYVAPLDVNHDGTVNENDVEGWLQVYTLEYQSRTHVFVPFRD